MKRLGDSGVHTLGDSSAFVNPAGQLLLTRRGKTRMDGVGIVFEFYIARLKWCYIFRCDRKMEFRICSLNHGNCASFG